MPAKHTADPVEVAETPSAVSLVGANEPDPRELTDDPDDVVVVSETSPLTVFNAKEGYEYGWFAKDENHPQSWLVAQQRGWRKIRDTGEHNPFGKTEFNELILMRRRVEIREKFREVRRKETEERIRSAERKYYDIKEQAERLGESPPPDKTIII